MTKDNFHNFSSLGFSHFYKKEIILPLSTAGKTILYRKNLAKGIITIFQYFFFFSILQASSMPEFVEALLEIDIAMGILTSLFIKVIRILF